MQPDGSTPLVQSFTSGLHLSPKPNPHDHKLPS